MTSTLILETLAAEFSTEIESVRRVLEMLEGGLSPAHIGRHRRAETGAVPEHLVRRMARRQAELLELDRRRASIRRMLESTEGVPEKAVAELERTADRFALEDLFLPYRKPEPEVQLALDRGLGALADRLVAAVKREAAQGGDDGHDGDEGDDGDEREDGGATGSETRAPQAPAEVDASEGAAPAGAEPDAADGTATPEAPSSEAPSSESSSSETPTSDVEASGPVDEPTAAPAEAASGSDDAAAPGVDSPSTSDGAPDAPSAAEQAGDASAPPRPHAAQVSLTPELARLCAEYVAPDRGVHTEQEALNGAMRILADRLGRSTGLRGQLRKQLRRHGVLDVRPGTNAEKAGRHKALLKIEQPMKQIQGARLIAIRQAQRDRAVTTVIKLDRERALGTVRKALARRNAPEFDAALDAVAEVALDQRLLPMLEADVRLELKERSDEEALRFLTAHLREVLLTPPLGPRPVAGVDISPKQDWTIVVLSAEGVPTGGEVRIETAGKDDVTLAEELATVMRDTGVEWLACSHNRSVRPGVHRLRQVVALTGSGATVALVNETGIAAWVNSEAGRRELGELGVQARSAVVLGRRLQDPLAELLKLDPRQLGLGVEKSLVSKANLRRAIDETVESCVALIGVDANDSPEHLLRHVPGLDEGTVRKLVAARGEAPFASREDLRERGVLDPAQWQNAIGFLRVRASANRLDHSSLHPDQYPLALRLVEATGESAENVIGRFGGLKGLRRADFGIDEHTWRDLVREIGHPGRDPRPRLFPAKLLAPDTDPASLEAGQVVEGFVGNVANFGAFVDLGLEREGFVHISALAGRFVRDARELTSIGRPVRAKVVEVGGSRIGLSLVDVPERERPPRGERRGPGRGPGRGEGRGDGRRGEGRGEGRGDGRRGEARRGRDGGARWQEPERLTRVARGRRDGMPGDEDRGGRGPRRGGPGGGPGGGRGGPGGGRGGPGGAGGRWGDRRPRRDGADADAAAFTKGGAKDAPKNNPFAKFFDKDAEPPGEG